MNSSILMVLRSPALKEKFKPSTSQIYLTMKPFIIINLLMYYKVGMLIWVHLVNDALMFYC